jgi:LysR family transcriptional regulator, cys regulon transcriptional activator
MNFQQLRIVRETVRRNFNLTEVANALFTSQSGVSKHIKDLEDELGVELFVRRGKRLLGLTDPGKELVEIVTRVLADTASIKRLGEQFSNRAEGQLVIATTHTQARYVLPHVVAAFRSTYPKVRLTLHQGSPTEIASMISAGDADIGICTETLRDVSALTTFPFYSWHHGVVVPRGHALEKSRPLTLEAIAEWPIITYHEGFTGRGSVDRTFADAGLAPDIVMSAMAFDPKRDAALRLIDGSHLFEANTSLIAVRKGNYLRNYAYRFIELCSPALPESMVRAEVMAEQGKLEIGARRAGDQPWPATGNTRSRDEVKRTG